MYYIVNTTDHIVAADHSLLASLSLANIDELYYRISIGDIAFRTTDECQLHISTPKGGTCYKVEKFELAGILGDLTIVKIEAEISREGDHEPAPVTELQEEPVNLDMDESELFTLIEDDDTAGTVTENDTEEDDNETVDFMKEPEEEIILPDEPVPEEEEAKVENEAESPILIDIEETSRKIGISTEDYNTFLDEYIDTALGLEEDLKSDDLSKRSHALATLTHLSNVLHLPVVSDIIAKIKDAEGAEAETEIKSFYATLARLTTSSAEADTEVMPFILEDEPEVEKVPHPDSFGSISLDDVKPIHFDFQLEKAAEELELPVSLIEEFVLDFIAQAKIETQNMLKAYEEGDLERIQKLGHLLKGTSSNLRITPLADVLYKIQLCEDSSQLEALIKEYWAHFLAFEKQIALISK